jgi:hypothetical protein
MGLKNDIYDESLYDAMAELITLRSGYDDLGDQFKNVALYDGNLEDIDPYKRAVIANILNVYAEKLTEFSKQLTKGF